ncbi:MAG: class I SAM-dependent methyltransferase [Gemmataceae bacterium]
MSRAIPKLGPRLANLDTVREHVILGKATFLVDRPADPAELVDYTSLDAALAADAPLPYWADIWPASRMLAKAILAENWAPDMECLELGCGLGLPGVAALSVGMQVTFSDADATSVEFAAHNGRINGYSKIKGLILDWREPPRDRVFPLIIGSDVTYEPKYHEALFQTLMCTLEPGGTLLLVDPDRKQATTFFDMLRARSWNYSRKVVHAGSPGQDRIRGSFYRVMRPLHKRA